MKTKHKVQIFLLCVVAFWLSGFLGGLLGYELMYLLWKAGVVSARVGWSLTGAAAVLGGAVGVACVLPRRRKNPKRSAFWTRHGATLLLGYVFLAIFLASIKLEVVYDMEALSSILTLEWTIFSISVTVFLVWDVVVPKLLEDKAPRAPDDSPLEQARYIRQKQSFYDEASRTFQSVVYLTINLFVLIVASGQVYLGQGGATLFLQTLIILAFYLCTNTLAALFYDLLRPLWEKRRALLREAAVTAEELAQQEAIKSRLSRASEELAAIDKLESVDEQTKAQLRVQVLGSIADLIDPADCAKTDDKSENLGEKP